ncbi:MAG: isoaspartyl peptidase/L-asparaginase family protein [Solirubrobacteraceae bacterium]
MSVSLRSAALVLALVAALAGAVLLAGRGGEARGAGPQDRVRDVVFAIHGGAGTIRRSDLTPEQEKAFRDALKTALEAGRGVLQRGGEATDAVKAAIVTMEDSELFNAGKGAVFTTDAGHELDASIMDGRSLDTGAVTGVEHIKNPILLADEVRTESRHVMFAGYGAELFAQDKGFDLVTQDYFHTDRRFQSLLNAKGGRAEFEFGTVGAVALDRQGDLAAGTSTGGLTNKPVGRIGDSPIIGAGTYANNATAAVSATGTGEFFIRQVVGHEISAAMEHAGWNVGRSAQRAIGKVEELGGDGGVIALDSRGTLATPFNTEGMFRGWVTEDGEVVTKIYGDE